jgi:hypothetical protein
LQFELPLGMLGRMMSRTVRWLFVMMPLVALAVILVLTTRAIVIASPAALLQNASGRVDGATKGGQPAAAPEKPDYDKDKEDVKRYLEWVIAIAGVFAVAQTLAAGFAAQSFSADAEKRLETIGDVRKTVTTDLDTFKKATTSELTTFKKAATDDLTAFKKASKTDIDKYKDSSDLDLKRFRDRSESDIDSFKADARKRLDNFEEQYKNVILAEKARTEAITSLRDTYSAGMYAKSGGAGARSSGTSGPIDWLDLRYNLFGKMDVVSRQKLVSVDRYLGFDLQLSSMKDDAERANTLRVMANFYISKFEYESQRHMPNWSDLQRAEYLLMLWIQQHSGQYQFHNDLGLVMCLYAAQYKELKDYAREREFRLAGSRAHTAAAQIQAAQQRAYYNLAVIERDLSVLDEREGKPSSKAAHLREALRYYDEAAAHKMWEETAEPDLNTDISYNIACCQALLAVGEAAAGTAIPDAVAEPILDRLEELAKVGTARKSVVEDDFKDAGGDFSEFKERISPAAKARLLTLKEKLYGGQRRIT